MVFCEPGDVVIPGDIVKDDDLDKATNNNKMILGPGLKRLGDSVVVSRAGILRKKDRVFLVNSHQRRYIPVRGENVIGIVVKKMGDIFQVDVGAADMGVLSYLAFENATKKNRPNVNPGDIVHCTIVTACPDMDSELVCVNAAGKSDTLGVLPAADNSLLFLTSLHLIRKITNPKCNLLATLGKTLKYDICVGANGRIWVHGDTMNTTLTVANAILDAENLDLDQIHEYCKQRLANFKKK